MKRVKTLTRKTIEVLVVEALDGRLLQVNTAGQRFLRPMLSYSTQSIADCTLPSARLLCSTLVHQIRVPALHMPVEWKGPKAKWQTIT